MNDHINDAIQTELNKLKEIIVSAFPVERIYLFGSYAYGAPNRHSDLDLYVVLQDDARIQGVEAVMQIRKAIAHAKNMPCDILVAKNEDFLAGHPRAWHNYEEKMPLEHKVQRDGICIYERQKQE